MSQNLKMSERPSMMTATTGLPRPLLAAFRQAYPGHSPDVFVRAPGRVNLLGGHVDMHDGFVITMAINREIWLAAAYGSADIIRLYAADLNEHAALSIKRLDAHVDIVGGTLPRWAQYPAGVAWGLQRRNLRVNGLDAAFMGDLTMRAGLSSSAAVEVAFAVAWQSLENWRLDPAELALAGRDAERDYMGVGTGVQDQFTVLHARSGHALWLDCRSLEHRHILLSPSVQVVICDTNTRRELAVGSSYNGRLEDCYSTVRTISLLDRQVRALRDVSLERLEAFESVLSENQFRRSYHVISEMRRVQQGAEVLQRGDVVSFGALMNESYWSARDYYGSSSPALDTMWQAATQHPGCFGARYSGGGGGGAIVALVDTNAVDEFIDYTGRSYEQATGQSGTFFAVEPVQGAGVFI